MPTIYDFNGRIAVVTGGAQGIGRAIATRLVHGGATVWLWDRDIALAKATAAELKSAGRCFASHVDVTDLAQVEAAVKALDGGRVDILVNNAGIAGTNALTWEYPPQEWARVLAVNLTGAFNGIQAVLPHMRARGGGSIVNIASIAGQRISFGGTANYSASKAGLLGLTRHAAYELAPDGIRVNAVCPGPTATGFSGAVPSEEAKALRAQKIPLGRMCEPEDIADPILFLAGSAARMITGVALTVDGGVLVKNDTPYDEYFRRR